MLKAEGAYILPDNVPANEFLNLENDKISTSRNWAVWLHEYLEEFPGKQDVLRYVLTANAPETKDNDFTWKDFQTRNNSELLAIFGNLVNRTMVLTHKYFEGSVPAAENLTDYDKSVLSEMAGYPEKIGWSIENYRFREALNEFMNLARLGNKYLTDTEPWKVFKTDPERVKTVLNVALQICANLAILCEPFMPFTSAKLNKMLNIQQEKWDKAGVAELLIPGHQLEEPSFLFEKIEDDAIDFQIQKLLNTKKSNEAESFKASSSKPVVEFDDFAKMDIRVGTILSAEKMPKTKKLLKLVIDTGIDKRTVVSGIGEYFLPEAIIGQQVAILVNLAPRNIKGTESQGMILMAENHDGELTFISPLKNFKNGTEIR